MRPWTAVSSVDWSSRKMSAMSSVVTKEMLTPVAGAMSAGLILRYRAGFMGAWPCLDATIIKVSS